MKIQIEETALQIQQALENPLIESTGLAQLAVQSLGRDLKFQSQLTMSKDELSKGIELFRNGFVLIAYSEAEGKYRNPHDHGRARVVYVVVSGEVEMRNYVKEINPQSDFKLALKSKEILRSGDSRIYHPGDIHDTRCLSESATILRLTSRDLKTEEKTGFMKRYESPTK